MSRSRVLVAVLAGSLLASACVKWEDTVSIVPCEDMQVGEHTVLRADTDKDRDISDTTEWTHQSGPGTLTDTLGNSANLSGYSAEYTATDPGSVVIRWDSRQIRHGIRLGPGGGFPVTVTTETARCEFEVFDPTVDVPVVLECETSRFKVEVGPRPVTAFHNGYIAFDTNVTTVVGMNYDTSEFELSVGAMTSCWPSSWIHE